MDHRFPKAADFSESNHHASPARLLTAVLLASERAEAQVAVELREFRNVSLFSDNPAATPSCCTAPWQGWRVNFSSAAEGSAVSSGFLYSSHSGLIGHSTVTL